MIINVQHGLSHVAREMLLHLAISAMRVNFTRSALMTSEVVYWQHTQMSSVMKTITESENWNRSAA